jgi:hypothetical protein
VEDHGVLILAKPLDGLLFWNAVKMARATQKRMFSIQSENKKLLQKKKLNQRKQKRFLSNLCQN